MTTIFQDLVLWWVEATDGNLYGFGSTGRIYKVDSEWGVSLVHTDPGGKIRGAEEFPENNGKSYLVWATDTAVHRKEIPGMSNWNDVDAGVEWPKTDLTSADWHTMKRVSGDLLILNKNNVALVGYDGSYSNNVLDLVPGHVGKTLVERYSRAFIGTHHPATPTKGVNAAIDTEIPLAQIGDEGGLYLGDMSSGLPIKTFPGGGMCNPGGVDTDVNLAVIFEWQHSFSEDPDVNTWIDKKSIAGLAYFGVYGGDDGKGGIYSYGRKDKNSSRVLNLEYQFDADEIGAVKVWNGVLVFSYDDGVDFGVKRVDENNKATAIYEGLDLKAKVKEPAEKTIWSYVEIFSAPLPANASIQFWYRCNKNGDFIRAVMQGDLTEFTTQGEQKSVFLVGDEAEIFENRLVLVPDANNGPEVYRIESFFN